MRKHPDDEQVFRDAEVIVAAAIGRDFRLGAGPRRAQAGTEMTALHPLTVADFMTASPHTIGAAQPLSMAREIMSKHGIRHLPVVEFGRLVGMLSERELDLLESLSEIDVETTPVARAVTSAVFSVNPSDPLGEVATAMADRKIGSAVVSKLGDVLGVFTTVDALRALATVLKDRLLGAGNPEEMQPEI